MCDTDILTELRAWRDEFARSHGYDLRAMASSLRALDGAAGARVVRGEPRRPALVPPKGADAPNDYGLESAQPDLQSMFKKPGRPDAGPSIG